MADGITCGATTTFQNDGHADASGDGIAGSYSLADISIKCPANFPDLGALGEKVYRGATNLQHGDGVGTLATSLIDQNRTLVFDSGKTLSYSTVGQANRVTRLGTLIEGPSGKPSGKDGCKIVFGAAATLRGLVQLYGCFLRTTSGALQVAPGAPGLDGHVINTLLDSAGSIILGTAGNELARGYNIDCVSGAGSSSGAITNFNITAAERITIATVTANNFIRSGSNVRVKDLVMIGQLQGVATADLRNTGAFTWDIVNPIFSGSAPAYWDLSPIDEWWNFGVLVVNKLTGAVIANVPLQVYDAFGTLVLDGLTDADGMIDYGDPTSITHNALRVRRSASVGNGGSAEYFPFTVVANQGVYRQSGYLSYEYKIGWAGRALPNGYGTQFQPMLEVVYLEPTGPMTVFHECQAA